MRRSVLCLAVALALACVPAAQAIQLYYVEAGGRVVGEGEIFSDRTPTGLGSTWVVKPTENSGTSIPDGGPIVSNARGGEYVQSLPDILRNSSPTAPPSIDNTCPGESTRRNASSTAPRRAAPG